MSQNEFTRKPDESLQDYLERVTPLIKAIEDGWKAKEKLTHPEMSVTRESLQDKLNQTSVNDQKRINSSWDEYFNPKKKR